MKQSAPVNNLAKILSGIVGVILVLLPFHAFLTVWLSSLVGHYTLLRLWKEFLLVPVALGALYILAIDKTLRQKIWSLWLSKLILAYSLLLVVCGAIALALNEVTAKAMWYGLLVDLRFLVWFLAVIVLAAKSGWLRQSWQKLLFVPAILVAAFAILQYLILPYDFLRHFGYSQSTIFPYETINHNLQHIRVASTLRGANPLGAYLILPICALAVWLVKEKRQRRDKLMIGFGLLLALIFSFSRSAWLGTVLGVLIVVWLSLKSLRLKRKLGWAVCAVLLIAAILSFALRNNLGFENAIFHTDRNSKIAISSNEGHSAAAKAAVKDIAHHPLGSGVGTAGPQSVYNQNRARIAENYFLQIGQEAGVLGMLLFIAICAALAKLLYDKRSDPMALALFASLIGLSLVNLLSHAWSDDTLAYVFWGLAAIALAPAIITDKHKRKNGQKIKKS
jgi:hypothetical protein